MRQYLLDLSLEEMSIDLLLQGDFNQRKRERQALKKQNFPNTRPPPPKKTPQSGFIPSSGIFISILCVGVILKDNKRNGQE